MLQNKKFGSDERNDKRNTREKYQNPCWLDEVNYSDVGLQSKNGDQNGIKLAMCENLSLWREIGCTFSETRHVIHAW